MNFLLVNPEVISTSFANGQLPDLPLPLLGFLTRTDWEHPENYSFEPRVVPLTCMI